MRWGLGLIGLLIAMAIVLHLSATSSKRSLDAVAGGVPEISEGSAPLAFDRDEAAQVLHRLSELIDAASIPRGEVADMATRAAGWTAATAPGSPEFRIAVKLRSAAVELRASTAAGDRHRQNARRALTVADAMLSSTAPPPTGVDTIRDQLENLQRSQQQQVQDVETELR